MKKIVSKTSIYLSVFVLIITTTLSASNNDNYFSGRSPESTILEMPERNYNSFINNILIRIDTTTGFVPLPTDVEVVGGKPGEWIDVITSSPQLIELSYSEINYSVLMWDIDNFSRNFADQYHTLVEIEAILWNIAKNYSEITSLYTIGTSYEGRDIWCLEITDNPGVDEREPGVFFMGLHHAREWPSVEICLHIAEELTSKYGIDSDITDVVDNRRLWLVPCVNPDGYYYSHDLGNGWRKNRHYFPEFDAYGVDLNRNYGGSCNGDSWGAWGSVGPALVSHYPHSGAYCGPGPISERETQAICNIFVENDISASISWHTFGELVLWPWGYTSSHTPDNTYMAYVGEQIASRITCQSESGTYDSGQSSSLYPTVGGTNDWAYGYAHYVLGKPCFAYTIEACTGQIDERQSPFHPDASYLSQICEENFDGAFYLLQEAKNIRDSVEPRVLPPVIEEMSYGSNGAYVVSWKEQNPDAHPSYFQLDELSNLSLVTDDAELASDLWTFEGFSVTDSGYHSDSHSFKSRNKNSDVSSMTTLNPVPITEGMTLTFWCWYDIQEELNYAFVEVSLDGRDYQTLDMFTGSSDNWVYKEYNLDEYNGESIFLRFRYTTDSSTLKEGFYVDDISPVADFDSVTTVSKYLTTNQYAVGGKSGGDYYYRVKGYNSVHGWGDFSTLEKMQVIPRDNEPPNIPIIAGPRYGKTGEECEYTFVSSDHNGDDVYYWIEWDENRPVVEWIGPYKSGEEITLTNVWDIKGMYAIKVKAKDIYDSESDWATFKVSMSKTYDNPLLILIAKLFNWLEQMFGREILPI